MIKYPNGQKVKVNEIKSPIVNYKNRGLLFEEEINTANEYYRNINKAIIYKKPTPLKIVKTSLNEKNKYCISEAYFEKPSTTDYNGIYNGRYIDFEAKETKNKTSFPLNNIHPHQVEHLSKIIDHGGIGFIIVNFKMLNEIYILDGRIVKRYMDGETSSIPLSVFKNEGVLVPQGYIVTVDYLKAVDQYYFEK